MASVNKVMIMGRLGQDPDLRYTQNQVPVCTLSVATSEYRMGQDGQRQETTEWHRVVVWQKTAENCAKYLAKGRGVYVEGRLQTRSWDDKNGQKRYTTEIIGSNVQFLPAGGARDSIPADASAGPQGNGDFPNSQASTGDSFGGSGGAGQDTGGGFPQADTNSAPSFGGPDTASLDEIPF